MHYDQSFNVDVEENDNINVGKRFMLKNISNTFTCI